MKAQGPRPDSLLSAAGSTFAVGVASIAIAFASGVVIARALDPTEKGSLNLAVASASLAAMILGFSLAGGATLAVARGLAGPMPLLWVLLGFAVIQVLPAFALLSLISTTPLAAAVLPVGATPLMIGMIAALAAAGNANSYVRGMLIGLQQIMSTSWRDLWGRAASLTIIGAGLALAAHLDNAASPMLLLGLTLAGALLTCALMVEGVLRINLPRNGTRGLRKVTGYAAPLYLGNVVQFLNQRLDIFLVAAFASLRDVGLYALAVSLAQLLGLVSNSVGTAMVPRIASRSASEGAFQAAQLSRMTLAVGVVGAVAFALIASPLVHIVYGQVYAGALPPLLALLPGAVALIIVNILGSYFFGLGRMRINLVVSVIGLCATLPLDLTLIPRFGATGAAVASSVSYSLSAIVTVRWAMKLAGRPAGDFLLIKRSDLEVVVSVIRRVVH